jgi:hypothetical protein
MCPFPRRIKHPVDAAGETPSRHGDRGGGVAYDANDGAIEASISREIDTTTVSVI